MKTLLGIVLAVASLNASALCVANTTGPNCAPPTSCGPGLVLNMILGACEPTTCPPGTTGTPMNGGGLSCNAPLQCFDAQGRLADCKQNPISRGTSGASGPQPGPTTQTQPAIPCSMTVTWVSLDPNDVTLASLTPGCEKDADLASSRMTTRLLGGR